MGLESRMNGSGVWDEWGWGLGRMGLGTGGNGRDSATACRISFRGAQNVLGCHYADVCTSVNIFKTAELSTFNGCAYNM